MPGGDKKWDAAAERDLCVALIMCSQGQERTRYNWPQVHGFMKDHGYPFTKDAISQHFTKVILKDFKKRHDDSAKNTPDTSAASTPQPKSSTKKSATCSSKKRSTAKLLQDIDGINEDDDAAAHQETPSKKSKKLKKDGDHDGYVKLEDISPLRERSATMLDNEEQFQDWLCRGR